MLGKNGFNDALFQLTHVNGYLLKIRHFDLKYGNSRENSVLAGDRTPSSVTG